MTHPSPIVLVHATAPTPGAIGILQLAGDGCEHLLQALTGVRDWPVGRIRLVDFAGIDEGLAVQIDEAVAQLMPHGGPRVVQRLTLKLLELGATLAPPDSGDPRSLFPEAADHIEALMLQTLAVAESPLAIDALLAQPPRWRDARRAGLLPGQADLARSPILNRLLRPPKVVLAGEPNVGKSTLSNALLGRAMSIAADLPGTTRDYVAGRIDLAGLVVEWHDTPGLHPRADAIERKAIDIARRLMGQADLLIAMRDADHDWPALPSAPGLYVLNKQDQGQDALGHGPGDGSEQRPLRISAQRGTRLEQLTLEIRERLVPAAMLQDNGLWVFDARLLL